MKNLSLLKNILPLSIFFIVIVFSYFIFCSLYKVNLLMYDDAVYACIIKPYMQHYDLYSVLNNFIFNTAVEHFQLFAVFWSKFFGTILPESLNIHPQDFIMLYSHYIRGILYIFTILAMTLFVMHNLNLKKDSLINPNIYSFLSVYLFIYTIVLLILMKYSPAALMMYSAFFRFHVPFIYFFLFFTYLFNDYLNNSFKHKKILIILFTINIIDGNEITIFIIVFTLFLLFLKKEYIKNNKILVGLYILLPFVKLLLSLLTNRYSSYLNNFDSIKSIFNLAVDYSSEFIKFIFHNHILSFLIFIFIYIAYCFLIKDKKVIKLTSSIFVSLILFLYLLVFYGRVDLYNNAQYVYLLEHWHVQAITNIMLMLLSLFLFIQIIDKYKKIKLYFTIAMFVLSFAILEYIYYFDNGKYSFTKHGYNYEKRQELYKFEKKYLALLYTYDGNVYLSYQPDDKLRAFDLKYTMFYYYISSIYKINPDKIKLVLVTKEEAEEKLNNTGLIFEPQELHNPKFQKLYDKSFILNNK